MEKTNISALKSWSSSRNLSIFMDVWSSKDFLLNLFDRIAWIISLPLQGIHWLFSTISNFEYLHIRDFDCTNKRWIVYSSIKAVWSNSSVVVIVTIYTIINQLNLILWIRPISVTQWYRPSDAAGSHLLSLPRFFSIVYIVWTWPVVWRYIRRNLR